MGSHGDLRIQDSEAWSGVDLIWGQVQHEYPREDLRLKVREAMPIITMMDKGRARGQRVSKCKSRTRSELNVSVKSTEF